MPASVNDEELQQQSPSNDTSPRSDPLEDEFAAARAEKGSHDGDDALEKTSSRRSVAESMTPIQEFLFVGTICLAQLLTQAGLGQMLSILHVVGDHFDVTNPGVLAWLIAGYSLTVGTFILVSGRLGDLFGYKKLLLIGFGWFGVWELVVGLAVYSNSVLFIFARVLSGLGPSLMLPNALAILGATYQAGPKKALVFALFGGIAPSGAIIGSVASGLFNLAWWPWTFWSMSLTLFAAVIVGSFVIPDDIIRPSRSHKRTFVQLAQELDLLGGVLGVTALVLINFAWNQAGVASWSEPYVFVTLLLGVLLLPAFFYVEFKVSKTPLLPIDIFNAEVGFVLGCIVCGWGSFGVWIFYSWEFLEQLRGASPLLAAAWFSPVAVVGAIASLCTAWLLGRVRPAWVMVISMSAFTIGNILIGTAPVGQTYWAQTFAMLLIIPFGMDMSFPAAALILSNAVARQHQGIGMSLVNTVVNYSIAIALGIAGTVEKEVTSGDDMTVASTLLKGYRSAWHFSIGLAGFGMVLSGAFLLRSYLRGDRGS